MRGSLACVIFFAASACDGSSRTGAEVAATRAGRHVDPGRVVDACLSALHTAIGRHDADMSRLAGEICAQIYLEPSCRQSFEHTTDPTQIAGRVSDACRDAYCPLLPHPPPACTASGPLTPVQSAQLEAEIRAFELGPAQAAKLSAGLLAIFKKQNAEIDSELARAHPPCVDASPKSWLALEVKKDGVWIGSSAGARRFIARCPDGLDAAAIATELQTLAHGPLEGRTDITIAAAPGLPYQDIVTAMDIAIKAGFVDVGLGDPSDLPATFSSTVAPANRSPARCARRAPFRPPASAVPCRPSSKPSGSTTPPDYANAPIIIITATEIRLDISGNLDAITPIAPPRGILDRSGNASLALTTALRALPAPRPSVVIVQADEATDTAVINALLHATKAAGYDVLFAVKNR